ncbi:hypothetical protein D3C72_444700 [compost metagenome]
MVDPDRQGFRQRRESPGGVIEGKYALDSQVANFRGYTDKTAAVGTQGLHDIFQRLVQHIETAAEPVGAMLLIAADWLDVPRVEQGRFALLQDTLSAVKEPGLDGMFQHHHATGVLLLGHQETRTQCARFALGGAHAQGASGIGRHLNDQFTATQDDQPLLVVEMQIHRAVGIQAQAAAVGQIEILPLPAPGVQIGKQRVAQRAARTNPQTATQQTETGDHPQRITPRSLRLQENLAGVLALARQASIEGTNRVERTTEAFLQACPGLCVRRVHGQPGIETFLHRGGGRTGAQTHHPVDGLLADRVQARRAHGAISLR